MLTINTNDMPQPFKLERTPSFDPMPLRDAVALWADIRQAHGFKPNGSVPIVKTSGNAKLDKEMARDGRAMLASHTLISGRAYGTCTNDHTCASDCVVNLSNYGRMTSVITARRALTALALDYPAAHAALLIRDIAAAGRKARRAGAQLRVRLNTNSDIAYEEYLPTAVWDTIAEYGAAYDYTKRVNRVGNLVTVNGRAVYRTTYSATSRTSAASIRRLLERGDTVTLVLPIRYGNAIPDSWHGMPMVSGDATDDRFSDPTGVLVGLTAKGRLIDHYRANGKWGPLVTTLPQSASAAA